MKKFGDTIGNRTCDLPACSAVSQQTAPLRSVTVRTSCLIYCALFSRETGVRNCQRDPSGLHLHHTQFLFSGET